MPNLLTKRKIAQLERAGVYYYDKIEPIFQREMNAYFMKNHRVSNVNYDCRLTTTNFAGHP